jgi:hypothetical protein
MIHVQQINTNYTQWLSVLLMVNLQSIYLYDVYEWTKKVFYALKENKFLHTVPMVKWRLKEFMSIVKPFIVLWLRRLISMFTHLFYK